MRIKKIKTKMKKPPEFTKEELKILEDENKSEGLKPILITDEEKEILEEISEHFDKFNSNQTKTKMVKPTKGGDPTDEKNITPDQPPVTTETTEAGLNPKEVIEEEINNITKNIADIEDNLTAIKTDKLDGYFSRRYIQYKIQAQEKCDQARIDYRDIRQNREKYINQFKNMGVDTTELQEHLKVLCRDLRDELVTRDNEEITGDVINDIVKQSEQIVNTGALIQNANKDVSKYCSQLYRKRKEKAKEDFYNQRDLYKYVRKNRNKVIEEFKKVSINIKQLEEMKGELLILLQIKLNELNPVE